MLRGSGAPGVFPAQGWDPCLLLGKWLLTPGHRGSPGSTCSLIFSPGPRPERVGEEAAAHLLAKALVPASPGAGPSPGGGLQEGREASPGGPRGNRAHCLQGVRPPGRALRGSGGVLLCLWCLLCVSRVPCSLHMMSTPWSEAASWEGGGPPPRRWASRLQAPATLPRLQLAAVLAWGRGAHHVTSQSPGSPCGRDELPHPPDPGPCTLVVACLCPGPLCSPPASGLRALSVAGVGGLSQLPVEVAACFPGD